MTTNAEEILVAAKDLFLAHGYDGVNLDRIAEAAGVSRQTVYNRFGSKEKVFRATVEHHWSAFGDFERFLGGGARDDVAGALRRFGEAVLRFAAETRQIAFTRLVIAESRRLPWIAEDFYRLGKQPVLQAFVRVLDDLTGTGALDCPDTTIAAHQFLGMIQEFLVWPDVMAVGPRPGPAPDVVIGEAITTFLARYGRAG